MQQLTVSLERQRENPPPVSFVMNHSHGKDGLFSNRGTCRTPTSSAPDSTGKREIVSAVKTQEIHGTSYRPPMGELYPTDVYRNYMAARARGPQRADA